MTPLSFRELQAQLQPEWSRVNQAQGPDMDVLMVPSLSMDQSQIDLVTGAHHYEERQLFSLIRLRDPGVRMVYATSKPLGELVVDAVLELLPGVPTSHARRRLHLVDTDDASNRPLTAKLLERPALLARISELLRPGRSFINCFVVSDLERQLSERLQVPLLGTDPALGYWGSKAGSRELFARCGVPHPPGSPLTHSLDDLTEATAELWEAHPELRQCVVKLNEGFSGEGNAPLALEPLQLEECSGAERRRRLRQALEALPMPSPGWKEQLGPQGALVEAWLEGGEELCSPSVQGTIHPGTAGQVEVLSSHEQVLGGASGQTYLGCSFPAAEPYRLALMRHGQAVGEALAAEGALERYAVDFIARRFNDRWDLQAIEVNLRQGGTTHPYMALSAITSGALDPASGLYRAPSGQALHYKATDNLTAPHLRGLLPVDLIDIVAEAGLHFDPAQLRGSVFHLLGCLSEYGKLGMTCIGRSTEEAEEVYAATEAELLQAARRLGH
ncbi:carboxylate-amine ligase [Cyanobium sp. Alchichica 3B3-8F6]|uniref:peptide ligase PGM1-related protein n=1 Tax=unclassified Cyanobium TaxID=2627006 RepID=UPI0020CEBB23|nr:MULTISPECIES: peptide ligase PGM1-related protein [unclassified Cyanobium]MCP9883105.1 carboxylate-amine ligase [Cyanobium sp. Alchichica 3B3-8F6]MCP9940828.1 carboxylate-amine ligase [Cyanobium sp. ATX 6E8]